MSFGDDLGAVPILTVHRDGRELHAGYIYRKGRDNEAIVKTEIDDGISSASSSCTTASTCARRPRAARCIEITGKVLSDDPAPQPP